MPKTAEFELSADLRRNDDTVIRTGKFFEVGKIFTDKNGVQFGLATDEEADDAINGFVGAPINVNHGPSFLDGKCGVVQRLWREGKDILAEFAIPKALHDLTGGTPIKVSSEWDMETKKPVGAAFVLKPAVSDAVMMAAFSAAMERHDTPEGQTALQMIHDMSARQGAVCKKPAEMSASSPVEFASRHEATAMQGIHDMAVSHGASCSRMTSPSYSRFAAHEIIDGSKNQTAGTTGKEKKMGFIEDMKAIFAKHQIAVPGEETDDVKSADVKSADMKNDAAPAQMSAADKKRIDDLEEENKKIKLQFAQAAQSAREAEAKTFVDTMLRVGKIVPAEYAHALAALTQALADDAAAPAIVKFSVGDGVDESGKPKTVSIETTRTGAIKAAFEARPVSPLWGEGKSNVAGVFLPTSDESARAGKTAEFSESRRRELLEKTELGRSMLREEDAAKTR